MLTDSITQYCELTDYFSGINLAVKKILKLSPVCPQAPLKLTRRRCVGHPSSCFTDSCKKSEKNENYRAFRFSSYGLWLVR